MTDETSPQQQLRPEARTRPTIAQRATSWAAWHAGELAAVGLPSAGAAMVSPWFWVLTAAATATWAGHETQQRRHRQQMLAAPDHPAVPAVPAASETTEDAESEITPDEVRHA